MHASVAAKHSSHIQTHVQNSLSRPQYNSQDLRVYGGRQGIATLWFSALYKLDKTVSLEVCHFKDFHRFFNPLLDLGVLAYNG